MGAWGSEIFSDDTAADIRAEYTSLIREGLAPDEATRRLASEWAEIVEDEDDGPVFWLALAATQSDLGQVVDEVRDRALAVIDSGENLRRWEDEASPAEVEQRQIHLAKLRNEIAKE